MSAREELSAAAADWVVRLSVDIVADEDWAAFRAFLDSDRDARAAYDRALRIWLLKPQSHPAEAPARRSPAVVRPWAWAAALAALVVVGGGAGLALLTRGERTVLQTQADEGRDFRLADGSHVTLGRGSQVDVEFGPSIRRVVMKHGDAGFQVAEQALRPFRVIVGDDALTVVHTRFDVHRLNGRLRVVVRQGAVAVGPAQGQTGPRVALTAGSVLDHVEGTQTFRVGSVSPIPQH